MQGKGFIKLLAILFALVCLLQFIYILPANKVESNATAYAQQAVANMEDGPAKTHMIRDLESSYLDSMSSEVIFTIPLLKEFTYDELKQRSLGLGLDLKGGQSVVLQVDMKDLVSELSNRSKDPSFIQALDAAQLAMQSSQSDFVSLFGAEWQKVSGDKRLANIFLRNPSLREKIDVKSTDGEVVRILREVSNDVVNLTFNRLKQRIDKLGVTQPNISLDEARDIILVELPGIDNPERARNFLQASAVLEFWDVYRITDAGVSEAFAQADQILKAKQSGDTTDLSTIAVMDSSYTFQYDSLGNVVDSILDIKPITNSIVANQGPLFRVLTPNSPTMLTMSYAVMGTADRNQRTVISAMLEQDEVKALFPPDSKFLWSDKPAQDPTTREYTKAHELYLIKMVPGSETAPLEGDVVTSATQSPNPMSGEVEVTLMMNQQGAKKWADMTTRAAQDNNREIAIVLDEEVVTAPGVRGAITGGRSSITGNFTVSEASDLASILEVGKLPAKVQIVQESNVGPSLGKANIQKSFISLVLGLGIVMLFMIVYYGGAGIISIIALMVNLVFIFGALASFGTVLTLPGIAGIVLTIGMAVDANVIIFERVREELRAGKTMLSSIFDGFKNSYSAIIDANVTTILVAIILAWFGIGPIRGFAVVLIIGVLSSLFTAVLLGRLAIDWWTINKGKTMNFWMGWSKTALEDLNVDWIGKRKIAYVISGIVISAGLISIFTRGFDLGVDFKGGYSYNIKFEGAPMDAVNIRAELTKTFGTSPVVKAVDVSNTFNVTTSYLIDDTGDDAAERVVNKLHEGINDLQGGTLDLALFKSSDDNGVTHITSSSKVGPTIADDIKKSAFYAGIFALLAIFLYIFIRFNKWQYSMGAVGALFHDTLITIGLFSLLKDIVPFSLEVDQTFIAAILTVIGYSINDTVIVYDRIREYLGIYPNKSTDEVLNLAINSTFSRTTITSMTTLFVVAVLLFFGGGSIKGFAFAVFVGILVGTYSSIFVATPIVRDLSKELKARQPKETKKHFSKGVQA